MRDGQIVVELGDKDCVVPDGESTWRPVTGADIGSPGVSPVTNWNAVAHNTHQDPNGTVCAATAGCSGATCKGNTDFAECISHLTVANQRGFCMGLRPPNPAAGDPGQKCLTSDPTFSNTAFQDACEIKSGSPM